MGAHCVLSIVATLEHGGVPVWLDGGWGVDALDGEQTREHDDLDCIIALSDASIARVALAVLGFALSLDELPTRFVMRDRSDHRIDFHTVTFGTAGGATQHLQDDTVAPYCLQASLGSGTSLVFVSRA